MSEPLPSDPDTLPPTSDAIEVLGVLGAGAMGVVYKARQVALDRLVAVKMILHAEHAGPGLRERFQVEAEALARLQHPNIVQIHEVGESGGLPYVALEFCGGGSLDDQLDGTPWPPAKAAGLVETLARAVHAAHRANVIHRDLKPVNVLLSADGQPKITDFGLAKKLDGTGRTQSGDLMGTPSYMPPEQASGKAKEVGPACDVYSLGAILYELLTGRPPFKAGDWVETVLQVLSDEPVAVRRLQPKVPRDLETICHQCLEKDPKRRYASAEALAEDLRRFGAGEPVSARPVGAVGRAAKWAGRRPAIAGLLTAVALVAAVGVGGILWAYGEAVWQRDRARDAKDSADRQAKLATIEAGKAKSEKQRADQEAVNAGIEAEKARQEKKRADDEADKTHKAARRANDKAAEARQEAEAAKEARAEAEWQAYVASIGRAEAHLLANEYVSADSVLRRISPAYRGWEYGLLRRLADGTSLTLRGHTGGVYSVAYSPDGTSIASASWDGTVKLWDARTGALVTSLGRMYLVGNSPGGFRLANASRDGRLELRDGCSGALLATLRGAAHPIAYSPDGTRLASASDDEKVKLWDAKSGALLATLPGHTKQVAAVVWGPDGTRLASVSLDQTVKLWDAKSGAEIATLRGAAGPLACSPDGTRLASGSLDDSTVKLWDTKSGAEVSTLRGHSNFVTSVCYSPDGTHLTSASFDQTVKVWDAHSGAELATLRGHPWMHSAFYSPDSTRLASASGDGTIKLWDARICPEIATLRGHTGAVWSVVYSPDGSRLASASADGTFKIWDARTRVVLATLRGNTFRVPSVAYSPDGRLLVSRHSGSRQTVVWDAATGKELLGEPPPERLVEGNVSPDGTIVAVPDGNEIRLLPRRPLQGAYDPWAEDYDRRTAMAPAWHTEDAAIAEAKGDWFAAAFHRRLLANRFQIGEPWHLRCLAWDELAGGDIKAYRRTCRRLCQAPSDGGDLRPLFQVSTALACLPTGAAALTGPVAVEKALQQTVLKRTALAVRAAALSPDNGVRPEELVALARTALNADLWPWEGPELLGAVLYRAGRVEQAARELHKAVELHENGGSTWTKLFLALACRQLGQLDEAAAQRDKARLPKDSDWRERLIHRQLSRERDAKE
jgi:WD40 repeat protein